MLNVDVLAKLRKDLDILCAELRRISGFCDGVRLTLSQLSEEADDNRFRPTLARGQIRKIVMDVLSKNPEGMKLIHVHYMVKDKTGIDVNRYHVSGALTQLKNDGVVERCIAGWRLVQKRSDVIWIQTNRKK